MYRVVALLFCLSCAYTQSVQSPQEILKEAVAAQQSGDLDKAIHNYRLLLAKYPNIAAIRSNFGAALASQGHYPEAIAEYKKALALNENSQVRLNLGLAYYKTADLTNAIDTLKKARDEAPSNLQIVTVLADCYLQRGQFKDVVDLLTPIQRADPDNQALTYMLGTALVRDGQSAQGQLVIDKLLRNGDSAEVRYLMGTTKVMAADYSGARDDFQKAAELNPNLPDVYAQYGETLLSTGDQEGARKAFTRELQLNPNNFEANLRLGVIFRNDENFDAAIAHLHRALQIRPGDPGVRYQLASIELSRDQLDDARRDLESLVKDSPDFVEAHVSLATVYFRQKRKADGERERAIYAKLNAQRRQANEIAVKAPSQ